MRAIQSFSTGVIADVIRRQPSSPARTAFAWQLVVGSTLARVASVELEGTTLWVTAADHRWLKEIERASPSILPRMQQLLGRSSITKISTR
jgi:hypothetical protein